MNVIRVIRNIKSTDLHIEELKKFIGKDTEIIILPVRQRIYKFFNRKALLKFSGSIKSGSDPLKFQTKIRSEWDERL